MLSSLCYYIFICKQKVYNDPYFSSYALSSHAIESFINSWHKETTKTNIKVSTYDPGPINSALRSSAFPGENKKIINTAKVAAKNFINFMEDSYES